MAEKIEYSSIKDNHRNGKVGDFLKDKILKDSKLRIVSAYFTIYAYYSLHKDLEEISDLRFLFGEPSFVKSLDPEKSSTKNFEITDNNLSITLESKLVQKHIASKCAEWIKEKAEIRSIVKPNFLHGKLYHIEQASGAQE